MATTAARKCVLVIKQFRNQLWVQALSKKGVLLAQVHKSFDPLHAKEGLLEYDALSVIYSLRSLINSLYTDHKIKPQNIESISIVTQEQFFLLWDKVTGHPLTPLIDRDCMRAREERVFFIKSTLTDLIQEQARFAISPQSPALKFKCVLEQDPELKTKIERGQVKFGTLDTWFLYHLTGQEQHLTDISNAAKTQFYNPVDRKWDSILCEEWGATPSMMPKVLPSQASYGETKGFVPLKDGIPIQFVAIEQVATLSACYGWQQGAGHLHFGEEPRLLIHLGSDFSAIKPDQDQFVVFVQNNQVMLALDVPLISWRLLMGCFGKSVNGHVLDPDLMLFSKTLPLIVPFKRQHQSRVSSDDLFSIIGVFDGMTEEDTEASVLISLVHLIKDTLDQNEKRMGGRLKQLSVDGDLAQSSFFRQILADMVQMGVQTYHHRYLTMLAALVSLEGADVMSEKERKKLYGVDEMVTPNLDPLSSFSRHQNWQSTCG